MSEPISKNENAGHRFSVGDRVLIVTGPFEKFNAWIKTVDSVQKRARVILEIFGGPRDDLFSEFSFDDLAPAPDIV